MTVPPFLRGVRGDLKVPKITAKHFMATSRFAIKQPLISNGTQLITQLIFLFPVPYSLFPLSTSEFNFVRLLTIEISILLFVLWFKSSKRKM